MHCGDAPNDCIPQPDRLYSNHTLANYITEFTYKCCADVSNPKNKMLLCNNLRNNICAL